MNKQTKLKSFKAKIGHVQPKSHKVIIGGKVWGHCTIAMEITASFVAISRRASALDRKS